MRPFFGRRFSIIVFLFCITTTVTVESWAEPGDSRSIPFTLTQIMELVDRANPALGIARYRRESAEAALITARAYPNPDLDVGGGSSTGIGPGALNGPNEQLYLSQPLDLPFVRSARRRVAEAGIDSANLANRAVRLMVNAQVKQGFFEILRRESELAIARDNERLLTQIRDKVAVKVDVGEAPRYEVVKAEAELLNAVKLRESSAVRVMDAKSALRALFGSALPADFEVEGELPKTPDRLPELATLREQVEAHQPLIAQSRIEADKAEARLKLEETLRYPQPTLKAGVERDPGLEQWRVGIALPLPLWNQRQGPIAEAAADVEQMRATARQIELSTLRELENAYNRFLIAQRQVETFETGLLKQAEAALKVAETAYRLGERGILDYLDAQRTFRGVRNDYINSRFDRQASLIDLERLQAFDR